MAKTILVTGAAGLVGQNLIPMLVQKKYKVIALDKNEHNLDILGEVNPNADCYQADLSVEDEEWMDLFEEADVIVDLATQIMAPTLEKFTRNNVTAQKNILKACKSAKVKNLVHLSSSVVISVADDDYTSTKTAGEKLVVKSKIPHTILRPPLMYGCFDAKHMGWLTKFMKLTPVYPVPGSGKYMRQPLYVKDLCNVIIKSISRKPKNTIHNIIGHERIDFIDMLKEIARQKGYRRAFLPIPIPLFVKLLNTYAFITRKPPFSEQQLEALTAGDDFPVEKWTKEFGVKYTPFKKALKEVYADPLYQYNDRMMSPH